MKQKLALICILLSTALNNALSAQKVADIDTVMSPASLQYSNTSFLGRLITGSNYRKVWSTPVAMPVFDLKHSGLIIEELGGGMQTKSLQLLDSRNREWVLRTVDKDAKGALPEKIRFPLVVNFVQDMISAAHPYAPLVVSHLAEAAKIIAPRPKLYFVPDDENFKEYRRIFANTVCYLERREPTPDNSETESTAKVMEEIIEENDHLVLQEVVLKARLLDMLIGDWDRHADQWRWGEINANNEKYYYAIPRDRDQAFFWTNGLLSRFISLTAMKHINGFRKNSKGLKNLNFKSWRFDKTFLNELDAATWERVIKEFQKSLTAEVIENAVKKLPPEVYALSRPKLEGRLKSRINSLLPNAMKYYRFISNTVDISGTDEKELFEISRSENNIVISIYRLAEDEKKENKIYERTFNPDETRFINLNGLGGNDRFFMEKNISSEIKIKINGGHGKNVYDLNKGNLKVVVYDSSARKIEANHQ